MKNPILSRVLCDLKPATPHHPKLLLRASKTGRTLNVATHILKACLASPSQTATFTRNSIRDASYLHSNERRLIGDGIADIFRLQHFFEHLLGRLEENYVTRIWTAWLLLQGLPEEVALDSLSQTECDAILNKDPTSNLLTESEQLAFAGSFSSHAAIQLIESYGLDEAAQLVLASNQRAPIVIRVNTLRFTTEEVMTGLKQQGIEATPSSYIDGCLIIQGRGNLRGTTLFRDGAFEFQDEASQLLIKAVPTTSERVIDYCAGAGGKTLHIASALPKNSQIIACDIRPTALKELQKRLKRNQLRRVRTHLLSKSQPQGLADCVLVDAPCSGSGILRRHAHNRHNMTEEKLVEITDLQSVLLGEAASLVAPGGTLIYATCSLLKSENEDQVHRFLEHHQGFSVVSIQDWWPEGSAQGLGHDSFLRVNPHQHHMDGFFLAKLVKKA